MTPRIKAFLTHLIISALVAVAAMGLVFGVWYPSPLHSALGVTGIFLLLLVVDVVLGPCLTLLVFKPGKKRLWLDMVVIVLLQLSALVYGLYTVAEARPAWIVFAHDRFDVVRVVDISEAYQTQGSPEHSSPPWWGPKWVGLQGFEGAPEQNLEQLRILLFGYDTSTVPMLYLPLARQAKDISNSALPLEQLTRYNSTATLSPVLVAHPEADAWLPLHTVRHDKVVLINKEKGEVVAMVNLSPWYEE